MGLYDLQNTNLGSARCLAGIWSGQYDFKGLIVTQGTSFSHAGILAKSFGILVLKAENLFTLEIEDKAEVVVDAKKGHLLIHPDTDDVDGRLVENINTESDDLELPIGVWMNIVDPLKWSS